MVRRIIRGVTKKTEEEKRREAFSKKLTDDAAQVAALLKIVQNTPYVPSAYNMLLCDALMVLYPQAWDTNFKGKRDQPVQMLDAAHIYFFGNKINSVDFATRPQDVYWRVFTKLEGEVKKGSHLTADAIGQGTSFLRTDVPTRNFNLNPAAPVTPEMMGFRDDQVATARRDLPSLWDEFRGRMEASIREEFPTRYREIINAQSAWMRGQFDTGISVERCMSRLVRRINNTEATWIGFQELVITRLRQLLGPSWTPQENDRDTIRSAFDNRRTADSVVTQLHNRHREVPAANVRNQDDDLLDFRTQVIRRMRRLLPVWNLADQTQAVQDGINRAYRLGQTPEQVAGNLYRLHYQTQAEPEARLLQPGARNQISSFIEETPVQMPVRRLVSRTAMTENRFIAEVLKEIGNRPLTGTAAQRLTFIKRLNRRGYCVADAAIEVLSSYSE